MRDRYLFIRLLEACNAGCFMCGFARSRDGYRFELEALRELLAQAEALNIRYVRFTGGEPLMHRDLLAMVGAIRDAGLHASVITNGALLPRKGALLAEAGLSQVIVSIDGARAESHDRFRNTPGLFERCIEGLRAMRALGVKTRVNSVAGPHNYEELPQLQHLLTDLGVSQWELSALKLDEGVHYPSPDHVLATCEPIYAGAARGTLVPMGKRFYGNTPEEQELFFASGIPPRPSMPRCHLVGDVLYLDPKAGRLFGCSLLPHREVAQSGGGCPLSSDGGWRIDRTAFLRHVAHFAEAGPQQCSGCSSSAAGYSDAVAAGEPVEEWAF